PLAMIPGFADINKSQAKEIVDQAIHRLGTGWLSAEECRGVLASFGIPQVAGGLARTAGAAVDIAPTIGDPVAAKLASQRVLHKSDVGAVRLNLGNEESVRNAFD